MAFLTRYHICSGMEPGIPPMRGTARTPWLDTVDIQLVSSRDGRQWHRLGDGRPFLPVGAADTYDAGMVYMAQLPVVRKDLGEIWLYYIGYRKGHWALPRGENEESSINLAKLRLDGFVSLTAGEGEFTTKSLVFEGERLEINARTTGDEGRVTVEVLDASTGVPLAGFGREDCDAFQGNSVRARRHLEERAEPEGSGRGTGAPSLSTPAGQDIRLSIPVGGDGVSANSDLRLGILGISHGHPYSMSAFCNGYDRKGLKEAYPNIVRYLEAQPEEKRRLSGASVVSIWAQDRRIAEHAAWIGRIPHVADRPEELVDGVDGVLITENEGDVHLPLARPFLERGIPIFFDRPLVSRWEVMQQLWSEAGEDYPLMSCSNLRYNPALRVLKSEHSPVGTARLFRGLSAMDWVRLRLAYGRDSGSTLGPGTRQRRLSGRTGTSQDHSLGGRSREPASGSGRGLVGGGDLLEPAPRPLAGSLSHGQDVGDVAPWNAGTLGTAGRRPLLHDAKPARRLRFHGPDGKTPRRADEGHRGRVPNHDRSRRLAAGGWEKGPTGKRTPALTKFAIAGGIGPEE